MEQGMLIRECLITIGATATFPELIKVALSQQCLQTLAENNFTHITFQCGDCLNMFEEWKPQFMHNLIIRSFGFNKKGLGEEMRRCQANKGISKRGLVICHAGAGTILEILRNGIPMVVVSNPSLLENHQEELAEELDKQGYATKSEVKYLAFAIQKACENEARLWTSNNASLARIVDEVIGYEDARAQLN